MRGYSEKTYGEHWAQYYDEIYGGVEQPVIDLLSRFAGSPPRMLELAVGTGRIAIPVSKAGVDVTGIDISEEMVRKLKEKDGGGAVKVIMGDFAEVDVPDPFPLIYLGFNTLFTLLTQDRQIECFQNAARHLSAGGRFVIEAFVPDMRRWDDANTRMEVSSIPSDLEHSYEVSIHYPLDQTIVSQLVRRHASGETVVLPVKIRYAWPAEIDLMARLAGLELEDRWDWYDEEPFTENSDHHVSVYRKPH